MLRGSMKLMRIHLYFFYLVMEICEGEELFDRIMQKGHYSDWQAATLIMTIVEACHSLGVMHRDLKPENFLFDSVDEDALLKTIDFGLSVFYKPGLYFFFAFCFDQIQCDLWNDEWFDDVYASGSLFRCGGFYYEGDLLFRMKWLCWFICGTWFQSCWFWLYGCVFVFREKGIKRDVVFWFWVHCSTCLIL